MYLTVRPLQFAVIGLDIRLQCLNHDLSGLPLQLFGSYCLAKLELNCLMCHQHLTAVHTARRDRTRIIALVSSIKPKFHGSSFLVTSS